MGFDGGTPLAYGFWGLFVRGLVVGRFLNLEGTVLVLPPSLALPSLPRWGEKRVRVGVGFGLGRWFSGRNHFVVGGG